MRQYFGLSMVVEEVVLSPLPAEALEYTTDRPTAPLLAATPASRCIKFDAANLRRRHTSVHRGGKS